MFLLLAAAANAQELPPPNNPVKVARIIYALRAMPTNTPTIWQAAFQLVVNRITFFTLRDGTDIYSYPENASLPTASQALLDRAYIESMQILTANDIKLPTQTDLIFKDLEKMVHERHEVPLLDPSIVDDHIGPQTLPWLAGTLDDITIGLPEVTLRDDTYDDEGMMHSRAAQKRARVDGIAGRIKLRSDFITQLIAISEDVRTLTHRSIHAAPMPESNPQILTQDELVKLLAHLENNLLHPSFVAASRYNDEGSDPFFRRKVVFKESPHTLFLIFLGARHQLLSGWGETAFQIQNTTAMDQKPLQVRYADLQPLVNDLRDQQQFGKMETPASRPALPDSAPCPSGSEPSSKPGRSSCI